MDHNWQHSDRLLFLQFNLGFSVQLELWLLFSINTALVLFIR